MATTKITINGVTKDIHDKRLPKELGEAGQVLKVNEDGTEIVWGKGGGGIPTPTVNNQILTSVVDNSCDVKESYTKEEFDALLQGATVGSLGPVIEYRNSQYPKMSVQLAANTHSSTGGASYDLIIYDASSNWRVYHLDRRGGHTEPGEWRSSATDIILTNELLTGGYFRYSTPLTEKEFINALFIQRNIAEAEWQTRNYTLAVGDSESEPKLQLKLNGVVASEIDMPQSFPEGGEQGEILTVLSDGEEKTLGWAKEINFENTDENSGIVTTTYVDSTAIATTKSDSNFEQGSGVEVNGLYSYASRSSEEDNITAEVYTDVQPTYATLCVESNNGQDNVTIMSSNDNGIVGVGMVKANENGTAEMVLLSSTGVGLVDPETEYMQITPWTDIVKGGGGGGSDLPEVTEGNKILGTVVGGGSEFGPGKTVTFKKEYTDADFEYLLRNTEEDSRRVYITGENSGFRFLISNDYNDGYQIDITQPDMPTSGYTYGTTTILIDELWQDYHGWYWGDEYELSRIMDPMSIMIPNETNWIIEGSNDSIDDIMSILLEPPKIEIKWIDNPIPAPTKGNQILQSVETGGGIAPGITITFKDNYSESEIQQFLDNVGGIGYKILEDSNSCWQWSMGYSSVDDSYEILIQDFTADTNYYYAYDWRIEGYHWRDDITPTLTVPNNLGALSAYDDYDHTPLNPQDFIDFLVDPSSFKKELKIEWVDKSDSLPKGGEKGDVLTVVNTKSKTGHLIDPTTPLTSIYLNKEAILNTLPTLQYDEIGTYRFFDGDAPQAQTTIEWLFAIAMESIQTVVQTVGPSNISLYGLGSQIPLIVNVNDQDIELEGFTIPAKSISIAVPTEEGGMSLMPLPDSINLVELMFMTMGVEYDLSQSNTYIVDYLGNEGIISKMFSFNEPFEEKEGEKVLGWSKPLTSDKVGDMLISTPTGEGHLTQPGEIITELYLNPEAIFEVLPTLTYRNGDYEHIFAEIDNPAEGDTDEYLVNCIAFATTRVVKGTSYGEDEGIYLLNGWNDVGFIVNTNFNQVHINNWGVDVSPRSILYVDRRFKPCYVDFNKEIISQCFYITTGRQYDSSVSTATIIEYNDIENMQKITSLNGTNVGTKWTSLGLSDLDAIFDNKMITLVCSLNGGWFGPTYGITQSFAYHNNETADEFLEREEVKSFLSKNKIFKDMDWVHDLSFRIKLDESQSSNSLFLYNVPINNTTTYGTMLNSSDIMQATTYFFDKEKEE